MALASSLETMPHQYKFGKHPDFGYTLRLTCEKAATPHNSEESTTEKAEDDKLTRVYQGGGAYNLPLYVVIAAAKDAIPNSV